MSVDYRVTGVDGCKGGWVAVIIEPGGAMSAERVERIADLIDRPLAPEIIAIDMPIGLPERIGPGGRAPERLARAQLGGRQSSVFAIPSRATVYASIDPDIPEDERYRHACSVARANSQPPRAISKQAFHIFPKIIELDGLLRERSDLRDRLHECHPEVTFWAMNGAAPLDLPKKVKNAPHAPGLVLRRQLLISQGYDEAVLSAAHARALRVGEDDLIDACAAAWTARRIAQGKAIAFPPMAERDATGLRIQIQA